MEMNELLQKQFDKQDVMLEQIKSLHEAKTIALETQTTDLRNANTELKNRLDEVETKLNRSSVIVTKDEAEHPFPSFGDQLAAIVKAANDPNNVDKRLVAINTKAASGGSALVGSDGAFLIHNDFSTEILRRVNDTATLYPQTSKHQCSADNDALEVPYIDETSRATGSRWGGVQIYREGETDSATAQKPKIGKMETRLEDLRGLAYMSNRLMRDARAMSSVYMEAFSEEFAWVVDNEIFRGTGAGQCLGLLTSAALISVAKETGQLSATFQFENAVKMLSRLYARSMKTAQWYINQDVWPQLLQMNFAIGTSGVPVFMPPGGASATPYGSLFGRPIQVIEQASTLGTVGDVVLADLSQYQMVEKGGLAADSSIHVRFLNFENTFRWTWSINGQPKWKTTLTPANGTATVSPFVALATR
jgi:HK97 family phage major capsid protein